MTGAGGGGGLWEHRARTEAMLADLGRSVASELGEAGTAGVRACRDRNEPGSALEPLASVASQAGLDPAGHADRVRRPPSARGCRSRSRWRGGGATAGARDAAGPRGRAPPMLAAGVGSA